MLNIWTQIASLFLEADVRVGKKKMQVRSEYTFLAIWCAGAQDSVVPVIDLTLCNLNLNPPSSSFSSAILPATWSLLDLIPPCIEPHGN
jgi:hypothetical protein